MVTEKNRKSLKVMYWMDTMLYGSEARIPRNSTIRVFILHLFVQFSLAII